MKPIWPKIPAGFVRAMLAGHSALGLAFAALIYLVCLTGSVAVLAHEFQRWERPQAPQVQTVSAEAIERLARESIARDEDAEHLYITMPDADMPRLRAYVDLAGADDDPEWSADETGHIVGDARAPWTHFLTRLHINLHLPSSWGVFLVGMTGVALLSSLISGLFAHPRVFRDAFHLRLGGAKRLQEADLHNRIGVWGLPFHIIISLTGALLGLSTIIVGFLALTLFQGDMDRAYSLFIPEALIDDPRPAPMPRLQPMLDAVARDLPGASIVQVIYEHPGERGQGVMIQVAEPRQLAAGSNFIFDGEGALLRRDIIAESAPGVQILQTIGPLHFGWFGGWPVKIAYILLGLGLTWVTSTGVAIWLARRRDKGRPAPGWERVWIAFVWSQPCALAFAALASLAAPTISPIPVWIAATLAANACAFFLAPPKISMALRIASGAFLLATAAAHLALHRLDYADPAAWGVNLALALPGAALVFSALFKPATLSRRANAASVS